MIKLQAVVCNEMWNAVCNKISFCRDQDFVKAFIIQRLKLASSHSKVHYFSILALTLLLHTFM